MFIHWNIWQIKLLTRSITLLILLPADIMAQEMLSTDNEGHTFSVTSGKKTEEHPFYNQGSQLGFAVDGVFGKEIILTRGKTYIFAVNSSVKHDFYFSRKAKGWGTGTVTEGITGQFIYKGKIKFSPNDQVPERIFYACRNHKYMGGLVHVINEGDTVTLEGSNLNAAIKAASGIISNEMVKQKITIVKTITEGKAAKKVENSQDSSARKLLKKAKTNVSASEAALKNNNNREALKLAKTALANANDAITMVMHESATIDHRDRYTKLLKSFRIYKDSYAQQFTPAEDQNDTSFDSKISPAAFQKMDDNAVKLSMNGQYEAAYKILSKAQTSITTALINVFHGQEVFYDKNFETAEEEFEYEFARYKSFEDLVPLAISLRHPSPGAIKLINRYTDKGKKIAAEAIDIAAQGDHAMAVLGLQESTRQIQRALATAGVR